jgi:hypothetical protein
MRNPVKRTNKSTTNKAAAKSQPKGLTFRGPDDSKSAQSSNIAGVTYDITDDQDGNSVLTVNGQSGLLDRFICDNYASAKSVAQLVESGKVLL